jgi:nucleoside-diphosphate-sugar epimerase
VVRLCDHLAAGRMGRIEHVAIVHNVPLRQLQTGDVSHFMFQSEGNILLEQAVHLFSIVHRLLGDCRSVSVVTGEPRVLGNGARFFDEWQMQLSCERGTASVRMALGKTMPESTVHAIGSDGAAFADLLRNACWLRRKTRWLDFLDAGRNLAAGGLHLLRRGAMSAIGYALALFKLRAPEDPFLMGMQTSLREFHESVRARRTPRNSPAAAREALRMCVLAAEAAGASFEPAVALPVPLAPGAARPGEVVVLGGAGFLGRHCVAQLRAMGKPVTLLVRRPQLLPADLRDPSIRVFAGDACDPQALQRAFHGASSVLHLATVAGDDAARVEAAMRDAVALASSAAREAKVRRFVYASSTAALYLGGSQPMRGDCGVDPQPSERGAYSRGKIAAEAVLRDARQQGLDVVIVRPAVVLGSASSLEHSGIGLWVRDNHCVGWGRGDTPLPLVLGDDCARGLVAALFAEAAKNKEYNLAGPVRITAKDFVQELRVRTGRDYQFHATPISWMWLQEVGKHLVKALARKPREFPSLRDLRSRSFSAPLDCSDAERDLGFRPEQDRLQFLRRLFAMVECGGAPQSGAREETRSALAAP